MKRLAAIGAVTLLLAGCAPSVPNPEHAVSNCMHVSVVEMTGDGRPIDDATIDRITERCEQQLADNPQAFLDEWDY